MPTYYDKSLEICQATCDSMDNCNGFTIHTLFSNGKQHCHFHVPIQLYEYIYLAGGGEEKKYYSSDILGEVEPSTHRNFHGALTSKLECYRKSDKQ